MSVYVKGPIELRLGDYRDVLGDVEPDAVITDPPYSERTHAGHNAGTDLANAATGPGGYSLKRRPIEYARWNVATVGGFVEQWSARTRGWFVAMCDDGLAPAWRASFDAAGRLPFAPLAFVQPGSRVRLAGDGPACWVTWIVVSRPRTREFQRWGSLPGSYVIPKGRDESQARGGRGLAIVGGKPLWLMRALVRDYSRPGDLVCDPTSGGATTLIAAALEGRRAIGAELDPKTFDLACKRIERTALTSPLPGMERPRKPVTADLFGGDS